MTDMETALKELRAQKDKVGTPGHALYKMLETAHPSVVSYMEKQAAAILIVRNGIFSAIKEKEKTKEGRRELEGFLAKIASRQHMTSFSRQQEEEERNSTSNSTKEE